MCLMCQECRVKCQGLPCGGYGDRAAQRAARCVQRGVQRVDRWAPCAAAHAQTLLYTSFPLQTPPSTDHHVRAGPKGGALAPQGAPSHPYHLLLAPPPSRSQLSQRRGRAQHKTHSIHRTRTTKHTTTTHNRPSCAPTSSSPSTSRTSAAPRPPPATTPPPPAPRAASPRAAPPRAAPRCSRQRTAPRSPTS